MRALAMRLKWENTRSSSDGIEHGKNCAPCGRASATISTMKLIVGLGNPGKEYDSTRHNAGFACVDEVRVAWKFPELIMQKKFLALVSEGTVEDEKVLIAKPQTLMNASGESVAKIMSFYHIEPHDLYVAYDDIDLPLGSIRVRKDGSAGTHNGMKSIIARLGHQDFPRIRIGIESRGVTAPAEQDLTSFVLHSFLKTELPLFKEGMGKGADALKMALKGDLTGAMERYN